MVHNAKNPSEKPTEYKDNGFNPIFSVFSGNIKNSLPIGRISLFDYLHTVMVPNPEQRVLLGKIRHYSEIGDLDNKAKCKHQLTSITPAVICSRRAYDFIESFTGLMSLDFDKLDNTQFAKELRDYIFTEYNEIVASWLSSSGLGVRALVRIPIVKSTSEFKEYFEGFAHLEGMKYHGFDMAPKNAVLPLFYSHDPDIKIRTNPSIWNQKHIEQPKPKVQRITTYNTDGDKERFVVNIIKKRINSIIDYGHPPLRAISYTLGGYVASGYISQDSAIDLIVNEIYNNTYLSVKSKVNGYLRTAKEMIIKGKEKPLTL